MKSEGAGGGGRGKDEPEVSEKVRSAVRTALLECLGDPEFRAAVGDIAREAVKPVPAELVAVPPVGVSDAEAHRNVLELIDERLRQQIRADAFRRPATATSARFS